MKIQLVWFLFLTGFTITTMFGMQEQITFQQKLNEHDCELAKIGMWEANSPSEKFEKEVNDLVIMTSISLALEIIKDTIDLSKQDQEHVALIAQKLEYCKKNKSLKNMKFNNDDGKSGDKKFVRTLKKSRQSTQKKKKHCLVC